MFPDARIVHTVRQPLDNILSVWFLYFDDHIRYGHDWAMPRITTGNAAA